MPSLIALSTSARNALAAPGGPHRFSGRRSELTMARRLRFRPASRGPAWTGPARPVVLLLLLGLGACAHHPTQTSEPIISSLTATPDTLGPADSTVVQCMARDPAGNSLVYDWVTDARLRIQGAPPNQFYLYTTQSNHRTFYTGASYAYPLDTAWVQCFVRDLKGGEVSQVIHIVLHH
ncbi:MAG TPA: hypothetical protein VMH61_09205 [Candidatus Acidoferrales bacterium]|nr:hypothetical protein [Candidatus Acidoferrales bacterium]